MIAQRDFVFEGIPWKDKGRTRESGVDCAGLAALFLDEDMGIDIAAPPISPPIKCETLFRPWTYGHDALRGDVIFFANRKGEVIHVAIHLGELKLLHILRGYPSRIDNWTPLLRRIGLFPVGFLRANEADKIAKALGDPMLGGETAVIITLLIISLALSAAAAALTPKLGRQGNKYGRYGFDALVTQNTPEVPLADLLGSITVAGNSPYTQQSEKSAAGNPAQQKANKIVVLGSAPFEDIDYQTGLKINGLGWNDPFFKDGSVATGIFVNPTQNKGEAVEGAILGDSLVPSVSLYNGTYDIAVPVDIRASYDREFPVYGLSGCGYLVFRLINSTIFQNFNVTCRVKGRKCRTFDSSGFIVASNAGDAALTGADGVKVRFKLAHEDIAAVSEVTVNGVAYDEISATGQTGNVYQLNKTKGFVEFLTAPGSGAAVAVSYTYYVREWTRNPASQIVYLLTENMRGMGFDGTQIDWATADDFREYCDEEITWNGANGPVTEPRFVSDYAVDFRKPIQEHIRAILDACNGSLYLSGGKFVIRPRRLEAAVMSFTTANILAESFSSELLDRTERANRVKVLFHSDEAHNAESEVIADDQANQRSRASRAGNNGIVEQNLKLTAVTTPSQAERLAETFLREAVSTRYMVEFTASIRGLPLQPLDVIGVTHPSQPSWADKPFRIEEIQFDGDDRMVIRAMDYIEAAAI